MHSRKRGKSGSKKPLEKKSPDWVEYAPKDIEELVIQLAKQGTRPSIIGLTLRDKYGVPSVKSLCGKTINDILDANGLKLKFPEDLMSLIRKAVGLRRHISKNKSDTHNKVKLVHIESKIRRLVKYYWDEGRVPKTWSYDPATAELLVK